MIDSSPKIDYLLEEFSGELAYINPTPSGIETADFDLEEEIRLVENLLYDNSSPRPPEELNLEIADTILESLFPSPILVEDSNSLMEDIDLFLASDDSMPPGIKDDDYESDGDIRFLKIMKIRACFQSSNHPVFDLLLIMESSILIIDSTQADKAQSSRVPVPLPEDPYEVVRQAYLDGTDTESEPFEDPIETRTPKSPFTVAPPTSLPKSTSSTLVSILRRTARMAVRVPPAMSLGLSASMAEVVAMSESAFCKRFRSSHESLPSLSPPDLPSRKRYRGTFELIEDDEEDDDEEDEEIEDCLDSDSVSEDAEEEGPTAEDEDPAAGDEGLATGDEGPNMGVESCGLDNKSRGLDDEGHIVESDGLGLGEEEEAVPEGQQQVVPVIGTTVSAPLGLGYGALRRRELALEEDHVYSTFEVGQGSGSAPKSERPERVSASRQPTLTTWTDPEDGMVYIDVPAYPPLAPPVQTPPSPEWTSGSLPISPSPSIVPSPISSPMIPLTIPSPMATPSTAKTKGFLTELGAQVKMQGD
ncbi:hypothetical protein Tco_1406349 [Tanacetum coccineum]